MFKKLILILVKFYQYTLSQYFAYYSRCKYYPTCSEYFKWNLENSSISRTIFVTIIRVLKCNDYFKGGFDYPVVNKKEYTVNILRVTKFNLSDINYWFINIGNNKSVVIKNFIYN